METSKERILKAVDHIQPEAVPINIEGIYADLQPWYEYFDVDNKLDLRNRLGVDLQCARPVYTGCGIKPGCTIFHTPADVYGAAGVGFGKGRIYPLQDAATVSDIENFAWPDPDDFDYAVAAGVLQSIPDDKAKRVEGKYALLAPGMTLEEATQKSGGNWLPVLCTLFDLFGFEETLLKLWQAPAIIEATVRKLEEFVLGFYAKLFEATKGLAQFVYMGDDFATQRGMLISPEHWRKYLKPTYEKYFSLAKKYDLIVWFHSCGQFRPVMGDLIDIGLDVWETVQTHLPGNEPDVLKREYGDHITFFGGISTQTTLPFGTTDDVRREVRERIRVLGRNGGYICGPDHGIMPDVPMENVLAMYDEARKFKF
jgi:uroporphyrinogen decarboxylase